MLVDMAITPANKSKFKDIESIPTGIAKLDRLTGIGGYPRRRLTMISGPGGIGKTTIALHTIREAQKLGLRVLYAETDLKIDLHYFENNGVDLSKLDLIQEQIGEDVLESTIEGLSTGKYGLFILDTVSKIATREELEKEIGAETIGKQAKLIGKFLRKLKWLAHLHNIAVVLLNHERQDIMTGAINTPGGKAIQEDVALWIRMKTTTNKIMSGDKQLGKVVKAQVWNKNQVAATEGMTADLNILYGTGFSGDFDLLQDALDKGVITKDKASYFFGGEKVAYGQTAMRELLGEATFADKIKSALTEA